MKRELNNQQGFVLITCLLMLVVLMIIGVAATNTTMFEIQISGNEKTKRQTFYQAEGAIDEATAIMKSRGDLSQPPGWMLSVDNVILSCTDTLANEGTAVHDDGTWGSGNESAFPGTQMMVAHCGIAPGYSLDLGGSRMHSFQVYGRSRLSNSESIIKTGFRHPYQD